MLNQRPFHHINKEDKNLKELDQKGMSKNYKRKSVYIIKTSVNRMAFASKPIKKCVVCWEVCMPLLRFKEQNGVLLNKVKKA